MINEFKKYYLGMDVCIDDVHPNCTAALFNIGNVVKKMFATDGVDDKVYFTITSMETGDVLFSGRNASLYKMPVEVFTAPVVALDDVGEGNGMNFYISTTDWKLKED